MKYSKLFKETDNMVIDKISEEFPVLTDEEKERIFSMSEKKYNLEKGDKKETSCDVGSEVSGVEQYHRPLWCKIASAAAAAVIVIGGISGGMTLLNKKSSVPNAYVDENSSITQASSGQKEEKGSAVYENIAYTLTNRFASTENKLFSCNVAADENDSLTFYMYSTEKADKKEYHFIRVTDPLFRSYDKLKEAVGETFSEKLCDQLFNYNIENFNDELKPNSNYAYLFSDAYNCVDFSEYKDGSDVNTDDLTHDLGAYISYNGSLYVDQERIRTSLNRFTSYPEIIDNSENSFSAYLFANFYPFTTSENTITGTKLRFDFIRENDEWKIDNIRIGRNIEADTAKAIKDYFKNESTGYKYENLLFSSDKDYDITNDIIILSHKSDESCTVYCTIRDLNSKKYLGFNAKIHFRNDGFDHEKPFDSSDYYLSNVSISRSK